MLDKIDQAACLCVGGTLASHCLEGYEDGAEFLEITSALSPYERRNLLCEIICYRIFLFECNFQNRVSKERYECISEIFRNTIVNDWDFQRIKVLPSKLNKYPNFLLNELLLKKLMNSAGIEIAALSNRNYQNLDIWLFNDLKSHLAYIDEMIDFLFSNSENKLRVLKNAGIILPNQSNVSGSKKFWILIFCVLSLIACLFFVPSNKIDYKGNITGEIFYSTVFENKETSYKFARSRVDYSAIIFREAVICVACIAGYTLSKMKN